MVTIGKKKIGKFERAGFRAGKEYPTCAKNCGVDTCMKAHLNRVKCPEYYMHC
jgi:hypothetical protein